MMKIIRTERGAGHSYSYVDHEGRHKLDGVTTLINGGMPKPALVRWASKVTAQAAVDQWDALATLPDEMKFDALLAAPNADRDSAASKGKLVHTLAEGLMLGDEVDVPDELASYVDQAVRFMDDWKIRPLLTETVVMNIENQYAGTLDMVVTSDLFPNDVIIADWKTSRSGIFNETALQLAAYRYADIYVKDGVNYQMRELGITRGWGVWIRPDGYDVLPAICGRSTFEMFVDVARVARAVRSFKDEPLIDDALYLEGVS